MKIKRASMKFRVGGRISPSYLPFIVIVMHGAPAMLQDKLSLMHKVVRRSLQHLSLVLLIACGQRNQKHENLTLSHDTLEALAVSQNSFTEIRIPKDTLDGTVEFEHFVVRLIDYAYYRKAERIEDTVRLETQVGENLDSKLIQIIPKDNSDKFKVYVALERNLTASIGEKQSEDLADWKTIEDYKELKDSSDKYFRTIQFHQKEKEMELAKDFQKIKAAVMKLKGEYITESLDSVTNVKNLPVELWVRRVIIKIIRINIKGTSDAYYIIAVSPWGC